MKNKLEYRFCYLCETVKFKSKFDKKSLLSLKLRFICKECFKKLPKKVVKKPKRKLTEKQKQKNREEYRKKNRERLNTYAKEHRLKQKLEKQNKK